MCNGKGYSTREDGSFALTRSAIPPGEQTQPQGIQFDETFRIALIISACIILERHHLLAIERIRRLPSDYMHAALVKLRSEEHTSELQSIMRNSYAVFCLKKTKKKHNSINKIM